MAEFMSVRLINTAKITEYSVSRVSRALHDQSSNRKISEGAIAKIRAVADQIVPYTKPNFNKNM
jgi:DNA-binding LacI/PurR family transcriptional regulator